MSQRNKSDLHMEDKLYVYLLSQVEQVRELLDNDWDRVRGLLGGKGANLADMYSLGVPVPPGLVISTEACNDYLDNKSAFPTELWKQVQHAVKEVEKQLGKTLGDAANPLLVSCRSGAKFSMPGMLDTVLNIGLNDEVAEGLIALSGDERFVYDLYRRQIGRAHV